MSSIATMNPTTTAMMVIDIFTAIATENYFSTDSPVP